MRKIKPIFRSVQFVLSAMLGGVVSYYITKYYDTLDIAYFTTMILGVILIGLIIGLMHYIIPEEYQ
jgi:flagellar biosynthesis protein FliR